jgi:hypothetical protein
MLQGPEATLWLIKRAMKLEEAASPRKIFFPYLE